MAHLTNFSFEFFYKIFTEDASQPLLYHGAKKSKMTKNSNQGGSYYYHMLIFLHEVNFARHFHSSWQSQQKQKWTQLRLQLDESLKWPEQNLMNFRRKFVNPRKPRVSVTDVGVRHSLLGPGSSVFPVGMCPKIFTTTTSSSQCKLVF